MKIITVFLMLILSLNIFARDYTERECPIVGNTKSRIFHLKGCPNYMQMLEKNKGYDNRQCFKNRAEAIKSGYRIAKNCRKEVYKNI